MTRAGSRKTILVSAYGCEPFRGSEAGVGWNWVLQMARSCDLHVIARANDREKIEANLPADAAPHVTFHYYDCPAFIRRLKKGGRGLYLYYYFWQRGIMPLARDIVSHNEIDYVMHLTFGSFWMPTFMPSLGKPFIWGPMGGGDLVPWSLISSLPPKERAVRALSHLLAKTSSVNPLVAKPAKSAEIILCRTENNLEVIPRKYRHKASVILETAMEDEVLEGYRKAEKPVGSPAEVVVLGRLVPFKNVKMGIQAFAAALPSAPSGAHLTILGDGTERSRLEALAAGLGVWESVSFVGNLPREAALSALANADVFLFPSLREGGSWSLMEGMAAGLPVVCLDWTGMRTIADEACAFLVPPTTYDSTLAGMTDALARLLADEGLRASMGSASRRRALEAFTWDKKGDFFESLIYGGGDDL